MRHIQKRFHDFCAYSGQAFPIGRLPNVTDGGIVRSHFTTASALNGWSTYKQKLLYKMHPGDVIHVNVVSTQAFIE